MPAVEREFGVPFPGREVPRERWTKTGYRDDGLPFDWARVLGREAPRVVDLGCGNGRFLISSACRRHDHDHLGVDLVQRCIDFAAHRANKRGLANVRFATGDAKTWLYERLDAADEIHVYHPQPRGDRLVTPEFLDRAWTVLRPGGMLVLQTDNLSYWRELTRIVPARFDVEVVPGPWPDAPRGRTRREIVARSRGWSIWRMIARPRTDRSPRT